ncbi:DNA/RNA non-specific endonuclease [Streptomyces sp. NPDC002467]|uniref:DNA/RNA non-specific endonuclease n=1 Tax=Streptomyces sp. NPDC002467 TaxID=3364647 RepID=UPI0036CB1413
MSDHWDPFGIGWAMDVSRDQLLLLLGATQESLSPDEARDKGGDSDDPEKCDDGVGYNAGGNITYLPRERFREGKDGCRAVGAIEFHEGGTESMQGGTKTIWKYDCERKLAPVDPPGYTQLPKGNRARGHLAGCQFGGSGSDLRNLVPLYQAANSPVMSNIENAIAKQIKGGQSVKKYTTAVYGDANSPIPDYIHIVAKGNRGMNVDCHIPNLPYREDAVCLMEKYE